jgi:hypothetical protein
MSFYASLNPNVSTNSRDSTSFRFVIACRRQTSRNLRNRDRAWQTSRYEHVFTAPGRLVDGDAADPVDRAGEAIGAFDRPSAYEVRFLRRRSPPRSERYRLAGRRAVLALPDAATGPSRSRPARILRARPARSIDRPPRTAATQAGASTGAGKDVAELSSVKLELDAKWRKPLAASREPAAHRAARSLAVVRVLGGEKLRVVLAPVLRRLFARQDVELHLR